MRYGQRAAVGLMLLGGALGLRAQTAVPKFDHARYAGTWYEIARYPTKREKKCTSDGMQLAAEGDKANQMQFVYACMTKMGYFDSRNISAKTADKSGDGKLKIPTLWPFSRKYWILAIADDDSWSLVGNPNHKELWVYARTATMDDATLKEIEAKADAMGYSSSKLVLMPQRGH